MTFENELAVASRLAREAGRILLSYYDRAYDVEEKAEGGGPVTIADKTANDFVVSELRRAFPGDGVVAEESPDTSDAGRFSRCWFVDPLDGTREFIRHNGEFAVHIGLAVDGEARAGVVYRPVGDVLYRGAVGFGCFVQREGAERELRIDPEPSRLRMITSRSHRSAELARIRKELGVEGEIASGSVGLKCGLLLEGQGELYVHASARSSRWDCCAPEAIVRAGGGSFTDMAGQSYRYDGSEIENLRGLVACAPSVLERALPVISHVGRQAGLLP